MTTKKKRKKPVNPWFTLNMDQDIRESLDGYLDVIKEKRNAFIQRLVRDHLIEKGFWPPKPKEGK